MTMGLKSTLWAFVGILIIVPRSVIYPQNKSTRWTAEIKTNLYQNDRKKKKSGEGFEQLMNHDPKHLLWNWSSALAWAGMASSGTGSLVCIDDVTEDRSSRVNSEVSRNILSGQNQPNGAKLIHSTNKRWPKTYSNSNPGVFEGKKVEYSAIAESISWFQPDWAALHLLKTKLKAERLTNKLQLRSAAVKAWKHHKGGNTSLVMSMSSRLKAVIACKGFSTQY